MLPDELEARGVLLDDSIPGLSSSPLLLGLVLPADVLREMHTAATVSCLAPSADQAGGAELLSGKPFSTAAAAKGNTGAMDGGGTRGAFGKNGAGNAGAGQAGAAGQTGLAML